MCMNLRNMALVEPVVVEVEKVKDITPIMDDVSAFETLCPVSSVTGHRSNPLDALQMVLRPEKARLLEQVLQEIPCSGVPSDIGTFEYLASRLDLGTDAERAIYRGKLERIADDLYNIQPALKKSDDIKFNDNDADTKDE